MSPFGQAGEVIIQFIFGLFTFLVLLRFLLQAVRADFYNPISQFTVKLTNPLLIPLRKIVPGFGGFDIAALVLAWVAQIITVFLIYAVMKGVGVPITTLLLLAAFNVVEIIVSYIYFWGMIIMILASWIAPGNYNPAVNLIQQILEPYLRPIRKMMPDTGGLDLSPMVFMLGLLIFNIFFGAIKQALLVG